MSECFKEAELYEETSSNQKEDGMYLISLLSPIKGCKILDLGCGTGYLAKALAIAVGSEGNVSWTVCKLGAVLCMQGPN